MAEIVTVVQMVLGGVVGLLLLLHRSICGQGWGSESQIMAQGWVRGAVGSCSFSALGVGQTQVSILLDHLLLVTLGEALGLAEPQFNIYLSALL